MSARRDPAWRDRASAELAAEVATELGVRGDVLVVQDPTGILPSRLSPLECTRWDRMDRQGLEGRPWPSAGPFDAALLRLPRSREAFDFAFHAAVAVTRPGASLLVYGAKDEGIASTPRRMEPLVGPVATLATAKRCRVLRAVRPDEPEGLRGRLTDWRRVEPIRMDGEARPWVSYPGTFAGGGVDAGSELLIRHLPDLPESARVLDFGAGTGVLSAAVRARRGKARLEAVEPDALARAAALENVPGLDFVPGEDWGKGARYDAVVSNPPYHQGKAETLSVVGELIRAGAEALVPGGELRMVIQRRHPVEALLQAALGGVEVVADEGPYRVWSGRRS